MNEEAMVIAIDVKDDGLYLLLVWCKVDDLISFVILISAIDINFMLSTVISVHKNGNQSLQFYFNAVNRKLIIINK